MNAAPFAAIVTITVLSTIFGTLAKGAKDSIYAAYGHVPSVERDGILDRGPMVHEDEEYEASRWDWE